MERQGVSRVQLRIIDVLNRWKEPLGLRKIAKLSGCSVAEVWRQVRKMERMNMVIGKRYGKYRRYLLNRENPLTKVLIGLPGLLQNYSWVIGKGIEEALQELDGYYISGIFAVKCYLEDLTTTREMLLFVEDSVFEKAIELREWFKGIYEVKVFKKDLKSSSFFRDSAGLKIATPEQAVADSAGVFETSPLSNIEAMGIVLQRELDYQLLSNLLEFWGDKAKYRIWYLMRVGRLLGMPLPSEAFRPRDLIGDSTFEELAFSKALSFLRSGHMAKDRGW